MSADLPDHPGVRRTRQQLPAKAWIGEPAVRREVALIDVSLSGARISRPDEWTPGCETLTLFLRMADGVAVRIEAGVVREHSDELALRFVGLDAAAAVSLEQWLQQEGRPLQAVGAD